jgi:hypothetical protein
MRMSVPGGRIEQLTIGESGPSWGYRLEDRGTRFLQLEVEVPAPSYWPDEAIGSVRLARDDCDLHAVLGMDDVDAGDVSHGS